METERSFEGRVNESLWACCNVLRGSVDAALYKSVILPLLFLRAVLETDESESTKCMTWGELLKRSQNDSPGSIVDMALRQIAAAEPSLEEVLPRDFESFNLPDEKLRTVLTHIDAIGDVAGHDLGAVYEYFLGEFAAMEGQKGGEFYTPPALVRLLVACLQPSHGPVYDPCCGAGIMFVETARWLRSYSDEAEQLVVYGQESNPVTWKLARLNLYLHQIGCDLGPAEADTFQSDHHFSKRFPCILANPPFNMSRWDEGHAESQEWPFGKPSNSNANFAWIQKVFQHLEPEGRAAVILSNGSLTGDSGGDGQIRKRIVDEGAVEAVVQLPSQLFYNTQISACVWFLRRTRVVEPDNQRVLFVDATDLGHMVDRTHRSLSASDISRIASIYTDWMDMARRELYLPGFARSVSLREVASRRYALVPGRYVGFSDEQRPGTRTETEMSEVCSALLNDAAWLSSEGQSLLKRFGDNQ